MPVSHALHPSARVEMAQVRHYEAQTQGSFCPTRIRTKASKELANALEEARLWEIFKAGGSKAVLAETTFVTT